MTFVDWDLVAAAQRGIPSYCDSWAEFGPRPSPGAEKPMRICPECFALVANERTLLRMHAATHLGHAT